MHAISSYCGNRPTNKQTHKQTEAITIHCASALLVHSVTAAAAATTTGFIFL